MWKGFKMTKFNIFQNGIYMDISFSTLNKARAWIAQRAARPGVSCRFTIKEGRVPVTMKEKGWDNE